MPARRASLHHPDLATRPGPRMLDRLTRSPVRGLNRLEQVEDVLGARGRPQREEMVVGIGERPAAPDRHQPGIPHFGEDHGAG
jgi:hypothetical protein